MPIYQIISGIIKQWKQDVCSFFISIAKLFVYLYVYLYIITCVFISIYTLINIDKNTDTDNK